MIEWWWLVVEFAILLGLAVNTRRVARVVALVDALRDPMEAQKELARRWGVSQAAVLRVIVKSSK
jgi:hypothetical protein